MFGERREECLLVDLAVDRRAHGRDASARRIHLGAKYRICRARLQTQSTMDALLQQLAVLVGKHLGDVKNGQSSASTRYVRRGLYHQGNVSATCPLPSYRIIGTLCRSHLEDQ